MTEAAPSTAAWARTAATSTALAVFMTRVLLFFFMAGLLECTSSASNHRERKCIPFKRPAFSSQLLGYGGFPNQLTLRLQDQFDRFLHACAGIRIGPA